VASFAAMTDSVVTTTVEDGVAVIRFDDGKVKRPVVRRHRGPQHTALDQASEEATAVALIGAPRAFSAGFDLSIMSSGFDGRGQAGDRRRAT